MLIVDRIEAPLAVCEGDGGQVEIPLSELPETVKEGDVLIRTEEGYQVDAEEPSRRRKKISALFQSLLES